MVSHPHRGRGRHSPSGGNVSPRHAAGLRERQAPRRGNAALVRWALLGLAAGKELFDQVRQPRRPRCPVSRPAARVGHGRHQKDNAPTRRTWRVKGETEPGALRGTKQDRTLQRSHRQSKCSSKKVRERVQAAFSAATRSHDEFSSAGRNNGSQRLLCSIDEVDWVYNGGFAGGHSSLGQPHE